MRADSLQIKLWEDPDFVPKHVANVHIGMYMHLGPKRGKTQEMHGKSPSERYWLLVLRVDVRSRSYLTSRSWCTVWTIFFVIFTRFETRFVKIVPRIAHSNAWVRHGPPGDKRLGEFASYRFRGDCAVQEGINKKKWYDCVSKFISNDSPFSFNSREELCLEERLVPKGLSLRARARCRSRARCGGSKLTADRKLTAGRRLMTD